MTFADITGMDTIKQELRVMTDSDKIPHALLLHGPQGIGKMRLARAFVQYICCTSRRDGDSCGVCPACRQTAKFNNPDVHYVYPVVKKSSPTRTISTDYIDQWRKMLSDYEFMEPERWLELLDAGNSQPQIYVNESAEIERTATLSTYGSRFKIFVVWLPEKLNEMAANKLLKLVEEPFPDTLFIMVSNNPAAILPTISSRLRRIAVPRPSDNDVATWLVRKGIPQPEAERVARVAQGNLALAVQTALAAGEEIEFLALFKDVMRQAYSRNVAALKTLSEKTAALGREKAIRLLTYFSRMIRENFICNLRIPALRSMTREEEEFASRFAPFIHSGNVECIEREINRAINDISRNANQKIVWFDFMLQLLIMLRMKPSE